MNQVLGTVSKISSALAVTASLLLADSWSNCGHAAYPERPIKLLVPSTAGGSNDLEARLFGQYLGEKLGQTVIVQDEPAGGGKVAMLYVKSAPPDGYTLAFPSTGPMVAAPFLYSKPAFDPVKDFTPVIETDKYYSLFVAGEGLPARTMAEFISYAKAHPNVVSVATGGVGTTSNLLPAMLADKVGAKLKLIPYGGTSAAIVDAIGGHVSSVVASPLSVSASVKTGKLHPLATTGTSRSRLFPDLPTVSEVVPGFVNLGWYGFIAPPGTPKEIVDLINKTLNDALKDPKIKSYLENTQDGELVGGPPDVFVKSIADDMRDYREVIEKLGIRLD